MTYLAPVHCGMSRDYTSAWPSYCTSPRERYERDSERGRMTEQKYTTCERCGCFISARGKLDKPIEAGAIPKWIPDEWGFCKFDGWDDVEMVRRDGTCEDWRER